jgi:hypothetical protein
MRELYNLVKFRNQLYREVDSLQNQSELNQKISILTKLITDNGIHLESTNELIKNYQTLLEENNKVSNKIIDFLSHLNSEIDQLAQQLCNTSEYLEIYKESDRLGIQLHPTIENHVFSKITEYCSWQYPALQINPKESKWIDYMVAADPLYLSAVDFYTKPTVIGAGSEDRFKNLISKYPDIYQGRLCLYRIKNRDFSILPQSQFGFVLCWDSFNFLSFDRIEQYIREVFKLLRPGGVFMFNYNDCDLEGAILKIESNDGSYTSARLLKNLLNEIGYEIISSIDNISNQDALNNISWLEVRKPGVLKTVKAHQALARILEK